MVYEQGVVVDVLTDAVRVEVLKTSACQSCQARKGCGQAALSGAGSAEKQGKKNHFHIPTNLDLHVGDQVQLGMAHDVVSKVALLVYIAPLLAAFLAMYAVESLSFSELYQFVMFLLVLSGSYWAISQFNLANQPALIPEIVKVFDVGQSANLIATTTSSSL